MEEELWTGMGMEGGEGGVLDVFICSAWAVCPKRERKRDVGDVRCRIPVIVVDITVRVVKSTTKRE